MSLRQNIKRWYWLLRCHRPSQFARRAASIVRRRLVPLTGGERWLRPPGGGVRLRSAMDFGWLLEAKLARRNVIAPPGSADDLLQGRFCFLETARALPDPVDWRLESWPEAPLLWRFHFHYHEYLLDLVAKSLKSGIPAYINRAWDLVEQWMRSNQPNDRRILMDAWHPACISNRAPVWIALWSASPPRKELEPAVLTSIYYQARFLAHHLEKDVGGNHLLENLRALIIAAAFLDGPEPQRWMQTAARLFRSELTEQVLPHGEHFERSPMYHAHMLEAVLDVQDVSAQVAPDLADACAGVASQMAEFLRAILHPDGDIPLLGDSCLKRSTAAEVLARAEKGGPRSHAHPCPKREEQAGGAFSTVVSPARRLGDYWIFRDSGDFLLFDAGPVGPDHLPAHAHADLMGIEASVGGRRFFVDSGVLNYESSPMRQHCRSTAAHNVLQVDNVDQCDMWSSFRMGYRGWPSGLVAGQTHGFYWARATHNAYRRLGVPIVGRWIACRPGGPWFCVDWAIGKGSHTLTSRLHLHPEVQVEQAAPDAFCLCLAGHRRYLRFLSQGVGTIARAWYCPVAGRREESATIQWSVTSELPASCGWHLARAEGDEKASLAAAGSPADMVLNWTLGDVVVDFHPAIDS